MESGASQEMIGLLAEVLRGSVNTCIENIIKDAEASRSHEQQVEFEWQVRFSIENQLVPSVLAAACGLYQLHYGMALSDASILNQKMPDLIIHFLSELPEAKFLEHISKLVDPERWAYLSEISGPKPVAVQMFNEILSQIFA